MRQEVFEKLLNELDGNSLETLKSKNAKYTKDSGDCLHNFKVGAEIMGRTTAQTCWGYMTKHLADLRKKVDANDFSDREDFLEKCQDTINYIRFLWCIGNEDENKSVDKPKNISVHVLNTTSKRIDRVYPPYLRPVVDYDLVDGEVIVHYDGEDGERLAWAYSKDCYKVLTTEQKSYKLRKED